jgi:heme exporter protein A
LEFESERLNTLLDSIAATDLDCERGGRMVFRGLAFSLARGETLSLEGPNGAGKTSALRILAGLLAPAAGSLSFRSGGGEITDAEERGRFVAWLGHHDGVKNQMSVVENARFFAGLYGSADAPDDAIARVGLSRAYDLPAQYLSAGQRRRLGLARLLLSRRPLWLLDEPLSALDAGGKALAAALISEHCGAGGIAIAATHEALGIAAQRLVMGAS